MRPLAMFAGGVVLMLVAATQVGPMVANLAISVVVLGLTLRTLSPRRVLAFVTKS